MCFSPEADLVGGVVICAIGVDAVRHVDRRPGYLALAALPLILGAHQVTEAFVWWQLQGRAPEEVGHVALWVYLLVAFVVLPVYVPAAVLALEPLPRSRWRMALFVMLGAGAAAVLLVSMVTGPVAATLAPYHLAYHVEIPLGVPIVVVYVTAVCGALLFSGFRHLAFFGAANLVALPLIVWLAVDGFASVWCAYAAVISGAVALHMRFGRAHRNAPYVLT